MTEKTHLEQRLDRRLADALLAWYDKTHGNEFGHDHHCPVPWTPEPHRAKPDPRCTCGWSAVLEAESARAGLPYVGSS